MCSLDFHYFQQKPTSVYSITIDQLDIIHTHKYIYILILERYCQDSKNKMGEASKRYSCCRFVVLPVLLVLIVAVVVFFVKNKVHPSPVPYIPSVTPTPAAPVVPTLENGTYGAALSTSLLFLQIQKGMHICTCFHKHFSSKHLRIKFQNPVSKMSI